MSNGGTLQHTLLRKLWATSMYYIIGGKLFSICLIILRLNALLIWHHDPRLSTLWLESSHLTTSYTCDVSVTNYAYSMCIYRDHNILTLVYVTAANECMPRATANPRSFIGAISSGSWRYTWTSRGAVHNNNYTQGQSSTQWRLSLICIHECVSQVSKQVNIIVQWINFNI